jgi:HEAT repeat protein
MLQFESQPPQRQSHMRFPIFQHFLISFRIGRTWFVSVLAFTLLMALFVAITFFWLRAHISLWASGIALLMSIIIALSIGWFTSERLATNAYLHAVRKEFRSSMESCYPDAVPITGRQNPNANLLILGLPGAGKTKELEKYQFHHQRRMIPILISMKYYDGFLSTNVQRMAAITNNRIQPQTLLAYLFESNALTIKQHKGKIEGNELVGMQHLRPYLQLFVQQGRIVFLCDGLNELSTQGLETVCIELKRVMQTQKNRVIMTCRELDFQEQDVLKQFNREGLAVVETIPPLSREEVSEFTKHFLSTRPSNKKEQSNKPDIDEIVTQITKTSRRYECTSPFILIKLIETLESIGAEQARRINSRGRLLRESMTQLLDKVQFEPQMKDEVRLFLSAVACTARRNKQRNAIQLGRRDRATSIEVLAADMVRWLDKHVSEDDLYESYDYTTVATLLEMAQDAGIITISRNGVLSFKHELIAEYFVAEYLYAVHKKNKVSVPFWNDMFQNEESVGAWSEPVALWAGLVDNPMQLAGYLVEWAEQYNRSRSNEQSINMYYPLMISLACAGVIWSPSAEQYALSIALPQSVLNVMRRYTPNKKAREDLARIFKRCADEGGSEVYRSLPPLLSTMEGLEDLLLQLVQLDRTIIPNLLFDYLIDVVEKSAYAPHVEAIKRVLGDSGTIVVARATALSTPNNSGLLRAAAIEILGFVRDASAVEPIIACLTDQQEIVYRAAVRALIYLGPVLTLHRLEQLLQSDLQNPFLQQIHWRILSVLEGFLEHSILSLEYYRRIIDAIIVFLASSYFPEVQTKAKVILLNQTRTRDNRGDQARLTDEDEREKKNSAVEQLLTSLKTPDTSMAVNIQEVLRNIGPEATQHIMMYWQSRNPSEIARQRMVEIMDPGRERDARKMSDRNALSFLIGLLGDESLEVQKRLSLALCNYVPQSIAPLIDQVISLDVSETVSKRAAAILKAIGESSVKPVCDALLDVRERGTRLLVEVLDYLKHRDAIIPLIDLLQRIIPQYIQLAGYVMQVLSSFQDQRVVSPLIDILERPEDVLYDKAIEELSRLGNIALGELIAALDFEQETVKTRRVRNAICGMRPFPQEQLLDMFKQSDELSEQIKQVFKEKADKENADETVRFLVGQMDHSHLRIRSYVHLTVKEIKPDTTVRPLVAALGNPGWQPILAPYLLMNPQSIPLLIQELGSVERSEPAYTTLLQFDSLQVIPSLILGLQITRTRQRTKRLIVEMVGREKNLLASIIYLFDATTSHLPSMPQEALKALQEVLTQELADESLPVLIEGLKERQIIEDCSNTLVLLARQQGKTEIVVQAMLDALKKEELRNGAKQTLVKIGEPALKPVSRLLLDRSDASLIEAAREILSDMGPIAFPILHQLFHNNELVQDAILIFRRMSAVNVATGIVHYLSGNSLRDIEIALFLLYMRIDEEDRTHKEEIIPALLHEAQQADRPWQRIIVALLLFNGRTQNRKRPADYIVDALIADSGHYKELFRILPFIGEQAVDPLVRILSRQDVPQPIQEEAAGMLGVIRRHERVEGYVSELAANRPAMNFGQRTRQLYNPLHYRALGGLLASGNYGRNELMQLRSASELGSESYEFYDVLLGSRNMAEIERLRTDVRHFRQAWDAANAEVRRLNAELDSTKEQLSSTARRNSQLSSLNSQLQDANTQLRATNTQLSLENTRLHEEINRLRRHH